MAGRIKLQFPRLSKAPVLHLQRVLRHNPPHACHLYVHHRRLEDECRKRREQFEVPEAEKQEIFFPAFFFREGSKLILSDLI